MLTYIIISALVVMLASLVGVFSVWKKLGTFVEGNLGLLVSFASGVFLVVSYSLAVEVLEQAVTPLYGLAWVLIGILVITVFFRLLPTFHHHHDEHEEDAHVHSGIDARRILFSDALHNMGDGILLAASFSVSVTVGVIAVVSVLVHELVQEISEFFVLKQAGFSTKKALGMNFLVSSTIVVGALGGYFLLESFEKIEIPLLGIAAGSFFVVVLYDLIPHSVRTSHKETKYLSHIVAFAVGLGLMFFVGNLAGHVGHGDAPEHGLHEEGVVHGHGDHEGDDHHHEGE